MSLAFQKFNSAVQQLGSGSFIFATDTLKVALTNTAPVASNSVIGDITQIAGVNGYTTGGATTGSNTWTNTSGTSKLTPGNASVSWTASGGSMGTFQYLVLYDNTDASKHLIGWWDYGSSVTLADTQQFVGTFDSVNGLFRVS